MTKLDEEWVKNNSGSARTKHHPEENDECPAGHPSLPGSPKVPRNHVGLLLDHLSSAALGSTPPDGLRVLNPVATKATVLVFLAVPGVLLPLVAALSPRQNLRLIVVVFVAAAMINAVVLSPLIVVPIQDATSLIAVMAAIGVAVASVPRSRRTGCRKARPDQATSAEISTTIGSTKVRRTGSRSLVNMSNNVAGISSGHG